MMFFFLFELVSFDSYVVLGLIKYLCALHGPSSSITPLIRILIWLNTFFPFCRVVFT